MKSVTELLSQRSGAIFGKKRSHLVSLVWCLRNVSDGIRSGVNPDDLVPVFNEKIAEHSGKIPLSRLLQVIPGSARTAIVASGLGVEGWIKKHSDRLKLETENNIRYVSNVQVTKPKFRSDLQIPPLPEFFRHPDGRTVGFIPCTDPRHSFNRVAAGATPAVPIDENSAETKMVKTELHQKIWEYMEHKLFYQPEILARHVLGGDDSRKMNTIVFHCSNLPSYFHCRAGQYAKKLPGDPANPAWSHQKTNHGYVNTTPSNISVEELIIETLQYVPAQWLKLVQFNWPEKLKAKIRLKYGKKLLPLFAENPDFFEVRVVNRNDEIRRAVRLHPSEHGMTKEEADAYVANYIGLGYGRKAMGLSAQSTKIR